MSCKKTIFLLLTIVIFSAVVQPAFALELNYPQISSFGAPQVTSGSDIIDYVKYVFVFLVVAAGIFGVISIAISGFIILVSAGNPAAITAARERIFGSILGIGLLMFSYIILRTINPQIIGEDNVLPKTAALYYMNEWSEWEPAPQAEPDVFSNVLNYEGWENTYLYYSCDPNDPLQRDNSVLVWVYDQPEFEISRHRNGEFNVNTYELPCINVNPIGNGYPGTNSNTLSLGNGNDLQSFDVNGIHSFKWDYKQHGVYYYLTDNCGGVSTSVQRITGSIKKFDTTSQDQVPKSLKIVNGPGRKEKYGVVLTEKIDNWLYKDWDAGFCGYPLLLGVTITNDTVTDNLSGCIKNTDNRWGKVWVPNERPLNPTSAFILNIDPSTSPRMGNVTFSNDYKSATISRTKISGTNLDYPWYFVASPTDGSYAYFSGFDDYLLHNFNKLFRGAGDGYFDPFEVLRYRGPSDGNIHEKECPYGRTCLEDITFKRGAYYVIVYTTRSTNNGPVEVRSSGGLSTCAVFNESVFGIKDEPFFKYSRDIYRTIIVPSSNYLK